MRLVDTDNAKECFGGDGVTGIVIQRMFDDLPTIDSVHAVGGCYCRECSYHKPIDYCEKHKQTGWFDNSFCSKGKRNEGK